MIKYEPKEKKPKDIEVIHNNLSAAMAYTESMRLAGYRIIRKGKLTIIKGGDRV